MKKERRFIIKIEGYIELKKRKKNERKETRWEMEREHDKGRTRA